MSEKEKIRMGAEIVPWNQFGEWLSLKIAQLADEYGLDVGRLTFVHDYETDPFWIDVLYRDLNLEPGVAHPVPFYGQFKTGPGDWHDVSESRRPEVEASLRNIFNRIRKSQGITAPLSPLADQRVVDLLEKILGKLDEISAKLGEKENE